MGLTTNTFDVNVLKNKTLLDVNFKKGSEYTLTLEAKDGSIERVRIPAALASLLEQYAELVTA